MPATPIIDSHVHLDDSQFDADRTKVYHRATANGVREMIVPATRAMDWHKTQRIARQFDSVFACIGLHPNFALEHKKADLHTLEQRLAQSDHQIVAIGECGLDGANENVPLALQREYFIAQLALAKAYQLPVIIHAHRAVEEVLLAVKSHGPNSGVVHSYNGSLQQAKRLIDLGYRLGFGGPISYPRANKLRRLVTALPIDSLLLETDAPYQPVHQQPVKRNEPANLGVILASVASLRQSDPQRVAVRCNQNARQLFALPA